MANGKNVRLVDIAREVGCTVNTVSRALRDKPDIGVKTKKIIKEAAMRMGYIPNSIASSLRSGNTNSIAIVFDNMINPYFMIMADKIHHKLDCLGYATIIYAAHDIKFKADALNPIISRKVDGIITFLEPELDVIKTCKDNSIPIILIGRKNTQLEIDSVSTADFNGGYMVGEYLVSKGAKNIGYIGAPEDIECSVRRLNGLKEYLDEKHLQYDNANFCFTNATSIKTELLKILKNGADAIFFFNDVMALEAVTVLQDLKIKIPEDIKIFGFDNIQSDFVVPMGLSTIAFDKDGIVSTAIDILLEKIKNYDSNQKYRNVEFDVYVTIRHSA